ncbi:MAG: nucleotidyltransferase [Ignavibacteria bacterium]|nr:nucleotidyltransferase [Ignavibacteria bacterium]
MKQGDRRVVVLAGGISSRMRVPLADHEHAVDVELLKQADERTKGMIGVGAGGRPFLDYLFYNIKKSGIDDVVIVIGEHDDALRQYYGMHDRNNPFHGLRISYAIQKIPPGRRKPLGTADALVQALTLREDWKGGDFIVCNSDNLYSVRAYRLLLQSEARNALIDYDRSGLEFDERRIVQFGITCKDAEGYLLEILEKPPLDQLDRLRGSDGSLRVSMNIFRLNYDLVLPFLQECPLHPVRQEKELVVAVTNMVKAVPRSLKVLPLSEHVPDLTYKEDIGSVQEYLRKHFAELNW